MSRVGKLAQPQEIVKASSEKEALSIMQRFKDKGLNSHYFRHSRDSFSVFALKVV